MPAVLDCPELGCWQALFDGSIPPDEGECYALHLESCSTCQLRLDGAEECEDELRRLGRQVGDPTTRVLDPGLSRILERLQEEGSVSVRIESVDMYFLRPSDKPGVLGILGEYEVREVIGQGGMGIVVKAHEPALNRLVAIKVMAATVAGNPTARQRFTREARSAAAVCHENIVAVHGVHESDGLPYLVMQFVSGESLQARLDRRGPLETLEIVSIGLQTARGLQAAHAQGLIHRDIKPANLLLQNADEPHANSRLSEKSSSSVVKITDFGLARMVDDTPFTQFGLVSGTPEYMAPEQARGDSVDHRADLFSLGSVLYTMCTGVPPFAGTSPLAVLRLVSDKTPSPIRSLNPDVPAWLETFVVRLMAKNASDRFQSTAKVVELLAGYQAHLQQPTTIPAPEIPDPPAGTRSPRSVAPGRIRLPKGLRPLKSRLVLLLLAVFGAVCLFPLAQIQPGQAEPPFEDIYQDFRGGQGILPPLVLVGVEAEAVTKAEKEGIRITLPARRKDTNRVGIQLNARIQGDFEITTSYEILKGDPPTAGHGVGIELYVATDPADSQLGLFRASRINEGEVYMSGLSPLVDGKRQYNTRFHPATTKAGRLRITRVGREAKLWVADGDANDFEMIFEEDLGPDDLKVVRVSAYPGHAHNEVDLRIKDLRIRFLRLVKPPPWLTRRTKCRECHSSAG